MNFEFTPEQQTFRDAVRGFAERPFALWRSQADFLAYDIRDLPSHFADAQRAKGMKLLTWTVRTPADRARAAEHASQIIYENPPKDVP